MKAADSTATGTSPDVPEQSAVPVERELGTRVFLACLFLIACFYATVLIYHSAYPPDTQTVTADSGFLERCRQICLKYGLVSTGNLRRDAENYIQVVQSSPLTTGLSEILSTPNFQPASSESNALLHQPAPDFSLTDDRNTPHTLSRLAQNRPVVVVFYLGYGCSHCVAQLVSLDRDAHYFRELDADIVAISADPAEHTAQRFAEYGRFRFNVLSDPDRTVAKQWGVFHAAQGEQDEWMDHGTFVVDRNGKVIWSRQGNEPWLDNQTLLHVIARSQGLLSDSIAQNNPGEQ
ncbi:MAG: putative peroxiredoxin [Planctomycetota bacterium]|jgi:peroxiredoxin